MASPQDKPSKNATTKKAAANAKASANAKPPAKRAAAAKQTAKPRAARRPAPTHEAIAIRAYELSQAGAGGDEVSHWLQAERELSPSS
jgi:hypothetical protein